MTNTPDPLLGVSIAAREIYDVVVRLTGRVDVLIAQQENANHRSDDHEQRIRALERGRWPLPTVSVVIAVGALVVSVIKLL